MPRPAGHSSRRAPRHGYNAKRDVSQRAGSGSGPYLLVDQQSMNEPELADAAEWGQAIIQRREPYEISPLVESTVGYEDYPALVQSYRTRNIVGKTNSVRVVYLVTERSMFSLEFDRYETAEDIFGRMLASWRFMDD